MVSRTGVLGSTPLFHVSIWVRSRTTFPGTRRVYRVIVEEGPGLFEKSEVNIVGLKPRG